MNRLLKQVDEDLKNSMLEETVFAQTGYSNYVPKYYEHVRFLDFSLFEEKMSGCNIFITHAGTGNIVTAIQYQKPMIVVPRLKRYGEHVDDHQKEIAAKISGESNIWVCYDCSQLSALAHSIKACPSSTELTLETKTEALILEYMKACK